MWSSGVVLRIDTQASRSWSHSSSNEERGREGPERVCAKMQLMSVCNAL